MFHLAVIGPSSLIWSRPMNARPGAGQAQQTQSKEEECGRFFRRRVRLWDPGDVTHRGPQGFWGFRFIRPIGVRQLDPDGRFELKFDHPRITHPFREKAGPAGEDLEFLA
jgi:hypothetical protein